MRAEVAAPGHGDYCPPASATQILKSLNVMLYSEVEGGLSSEQANKRLRLFVPAAAELSRQREAKQLGPKHQLSMVRAALRLGRQVPAPCPLPLALSGTSALCCCLVLPHSHIPSSRHEVHLPKSDIEPSLTCQLVCRMS